MIYQGTQNFPRAQVYSYATVLDHPDYHKSVQKYTINTGTQRPEDIGSQASETQELGTRGPRVLRAVLHCSS